MAELIFLFFLSRNFLHSGIFVAVVVVAAAVAVVVVGGDGVGVGTTVVVGVVSFV